jgi:hypothetical protein
MHSSRLVHVVHDPGFVNHLGFAVQGQFSVFHRAPVTGKQLEQLISSGLAVERSDAVGDFGRVVDDLVSGDFGLLFVRCLVGDRVISDPENMLDPKVAQGQARGQRGAVGGGWSGGGILTPGRLSTERQQH